MAERILRSVCFIAAWVLAVPGRAGAYAPAAGLNPVAASHQPIKKGKAVPELNIGAAGGVVVLLGGGLLILAGRRRAKRD